jgi:hypothetical protein
MLIADSLSSKVPRAVRSLSIPITAAIGLTLGWVLRFCRSSILVYFANAVVVFGLNYGLATLATVAMRLFIHALRSVRMSETS